MSERRWIGKVFIATSLDGFIARPDGDIDWLGNQPDAVHATGDAGIADDLGYAEHMADVDHVVMGRGTYEKVLTFGVWPYGGQQVIVVSTGLATDDDRITVTRSVDETVELLDERGAKAVYVDGGATIQAFLRAGFIDTIVLTRVPVLIGQGRPLFGSLDADVHLAHEGTVASGGGYVQSRYRVLRS